MNTRTRMLTLALALGVMPVLGACNRDADVDDDVDVPPATEITPAAARVTDIDLGRSIGSDNRITDTNETDEFRPDDTVYVSVSTEGAATGGTLAARWTFEDGQVVDETSQTLSATGPAVTHFHIAKPGGFPVGKYKVEILLNGQSAQSKDFEIKM